MSTILPVIRPLRKSGGLRGLVGLGKFSGTFAQKGCYHVFSPELGTSGERLTSNQKNQYCTPYDGLHKQVFQILFLFYA